MTQTATATQAKTVSPVDIAGYLDLAMQCLKGIMWAKSVKLVPVTFNGQDYDAILIEVAHNGNDIGKLEVSATRQVNGRDAYFVRMRLIDWSLPRAHDDFFFMPKQMRPKHVASYANCFMNIHGLTHIALTYYMMEQARFFDNSCRGNRHTTIVHTFSDSAIAAKLKLFELGVCDFTAMMNRNGETVMLLKDASGETLTQYINKFKPWDVRAHLNNIFNDY